MKRPIAPVRTAWIPQFLLSLHWPEDPAIRNKSNPMITRILFIAGALLLAVSCGPRQQPQAEPADEPLLHSEVH